MSHCPAASGTGCSQHSEGRWAPGWRNSLNDSREHRSSRRDLGVGSSPLLGKSRYTVYPRWPQGYRWEWTTSPQLEKKRETFRGGGHASRSQEVFHFSFISPCRELPPQTPDWLCLWRETLVQVVSVSLFVLTGFTEGEIAHRKTYASGEINKNQDSGE